VTLAFDDAGDRDAPAVVLLHSTVCDRRMWDPQWEPIQEAGFRAIRFDFPGHGETPPATGDHNPAELVMAGLDALGVDRASFVGASFGGRVSQEIGARWPGRVTALALICAAARGLTPTAAFQAFAEREDVLIEGGDVDGAVALNVDTFLGRRADPMTRTKVAAMQKHAFDVQLPVPYIPPRDVDYDLAGIVAPTLVVSGGHDVDFFQQTADMLVATIPGAQRVHLDWAGHLPTVEDPAATTPMLLEWLGKTS
jgi:pimeloyl-ACP methyl ester carboxylesterase